MIMIRWNASRIWPAQGQWRGSRSWRRRPPRLSRAGTCSILNRSSLRLGGGQVTVEGEQPQPGGQVGGDGDELQPGLVDGVLA